MNTTMKTLKNFLELAALVLFALLVPTLSQAQQNLIVQTTLTTALTAPASPATGVAPVPYAAVVLGSTTGLVGYTLNNTTTINAQQFWVLYIDREEMAVIQVNGTVAQVVRGYNSTVATSHQTGAMVLYGKAAWFYSYDPGTTFAQGGSGVSGGTVCTVAGQFAFPWVNVRTGSEWACSPQTLTYVPWFNNSNNPNSSVDFGTTAAVAGAQPIIAPLFRLSGTNAISSFLIPVGFNATAVGGGQFCIVPTGAFTWTLTNNIADAGTAVVGKTLCFTWDAGTAKFSSSY
jgi:hypothetical protein